MSGHTRWRDLRHKADLQRVVMTVVMEGGDLDGATLITVQEALTVEGAIALVEVDGWRVIASEVVPRPSL